AQRARRQANQAAKLEWARWHVGDDDRALRRSCHMIGLERFLPFRQRMGKLIQWARMVADDGAHRVEELRARPPWIDNRIQAPQVTRRRWQHGNDIGHWCAGRYQDYRIRLHVWQLHLHLEPAIAKVDAAPIRKAR